MSTLASYWARFVPMIGYHHVLMIITSISIILLSILLAGCTSTGMSEVYLMSLQYNTPNPSIPTLPGEVNPSIAHAIHNISQAGNGSTFEVRVGYMGICWGQSDVNRICSGSAEALARIIRVEKKTISQGNTSTEVTVDPLNLVMVAEEFRKKIVFDGLIYIVIAVSFLAFLLLSTFPGWHEEVDDSGSEREVKPFPSRPVSYAAFYSLAIAFAFGFVSALWQHINSSSTASMVETLSYGAVSGHVGPAAMALGWIAIGLIGTAALGMIVMILSIRLIRKLTDEE